MPASQDSLAHAIGSVLRKGYEDLMATMTKSKKKSKKIVPWQISSELSQWEDKILERKKKFDDMWL